MEEDNDAEMLSSAVDDSPGADDVPETDGGQSPTPSTEVEHQLSLKFDKTAPFKNHPQSYELYTSIDSSRTRRKIRKALERLHKFSFGHNTLLGAASKMTYNEILADMMFEGEEVVPVRPLLVKNYRRMSGDHKTLKEERFGIRMFLTNRRIFMLDAGAHHVPTLEDHVDNLGIMRLRELEINYVVKDEVWYYPVPLANLKGVSLDINFQTVAHGWLMQKRPLSLCACLLAFAAAMLYHANNMTPVWVLLEQMTFSETSDAQVTSEPHGAIPVGFQDSGSSSWSDRMDMTVEDQHEAYKALFICFALVSLVPVAFFKIESYSKTNFNASMAQKRAITLGALDPVTQRHCIFELMLDDRYGMKQIQEYVHLLQEYSPHLAGQVLD
eukprot:SAG31_NODE_832_length_11660_cov_2.612091_2_plen_384_part_00